MAKAPKTKTTAKAKKADTAKSKTPKAEAAKSDTTTAATSETSTASDTSADTSTDTSSGASDSASGGSKKASTDTRPISYFSSVATEDYRSGWDGIFGGGGKESGTSKPEKSKASKRKSQLPLTLTLEAEDLDAETRGLLEDVLRKQAKKKRLNYDKLSGNGQISWQISCRISSA